MAAAISAVNTSQSFLIAHLLRKKTKNAPFFTENHHLFHFSAISLIGCGLSGAVGVGTLLAGGYIPFGSFISAIWTWTVADPAGIMMIAPILLIQNTSSVGPQWPDVSRNEVLVFILTGTGLTVLLFSPASPLQHAVNLFYLTLIVMVWSCFKFPRRFIAGMILAASSVAILGTFLNIDLFSESDTSRSLLQVQFFLILLSVITLQLLCVIAEKDSALCRLEKYTNALEIKVEDTSRQLKVLSGIIPICAMCKKIRDKGGNWVGLEKYLDEHSETQLTHGYCPDCANKLLRSIPET